MPAAKGAKRAAKAQSEPVAKKARADPQLAAVLEAIGQANSLPEDCRDLLTTVAPNCLQIPADERHKTQATVVSWISGVLDGVREKLQAAVDDADAEASGADGTKESLSTKAAEAQATLDAVKESVASKQSALDEAKQSVNTAKAQLAEARAAKNQVGAKAEELRKERSGFEAALTEDLTYMKQEDGFEVGEAEKRTSSLVTMTEKLGLEASLLLALPAAFAKRPSQRGPFDHAVFEQVESSIARKIQELEAVIEAMTSAAQEGEASLEAAQDGVSRAEKTQQAAVEEFEAAEAESRQAAQALGEAEAAVLTFANQRAPAEEARKAKAAALQNFTDYNLECFNMLRDKAAATAGA